MRIYCNCKNCWGINGVRLLLVSIYIYTLNKEHGMEFLLVSFVYIISHPHATFIYYPLPPTHTSIHTYTHNSGLPGRSDNDVKNRWHSKMRSRSVKRKERLSSCGGGGSGVVVVHSQQQQQQQGGGSGEEAHGNYAAAYHNGSSRNIMMNNASTTSKRSKLSSSTMGGGGESSARINGMALNHNTQQQQQFAMNNMDPWSSSSRSSTSNTNALSQDGVYENAQQNQVFNGK